MWVDICEQFFITQRTAEEDKISLATFHMTGEAQLWYYQVEQEELGIKMGIFKSYCFMRFGPPISNNRLGELANLERTGTVKDYALLECDEFLSEDPFPASSGTD